MIPDRALRHMFRSDQATALLGDLARAVTGVFVVLLIAAWTLYYSLLVPMVFTRLQMNDFGKFYYSTRLFLDGRPMYGPSPATAIPVGPDETRQFWNLNPPHFHLPLLPLAGLPPATAYAVWAGLSLAALLISLRLISRELAVRWTPSRVIWATFAAVVWSATETTVVTGQLTFLLMLGVTVAWRAARRGDWITAGIWLGVLASTKLFLGVFGLYFLVTGRFRPALAMAGSGAACFTVGLAVFGWAPHVEWVGALQRVDWAWAAMNASLPGIVARSLDVSPLFTPVWLAPHLVPALSWFGAGTIAAITLRQVMRTSAAGETDRTFLLLLLMAQLVAPLGWVYYSWIAVGPFAAWWRTGPRLPISAAAWLPAVPGFFMPVGLATLWAGSAWAAPTIASAYFWMVLTVWWLVLIRLPPAAAA